MQVAYSGTGGKVRRYTCVRGRDSHGTGKACQTVGGARLDKTVAGAFLEAAAPAGIAATAGAIRELEDQHEQRLAGQRLALERARPTALSDHEREALVRLARELPMLWAAETTTDRDRKELLRTLIGEVIVTADHDKRRAAVEVQWQGAARTELSFPLKVPGRWSRAASPGTRWS